MPFSLTPGGRLVQGTPSESSFQKNVACLEPHQRFCQFFFDSVLTMLFLVAIKNFEFSQAK